MTAKKKQPAPARPAGRKGRIIMSEAIYPFEYYNTLGTDCVGKVYEMINRGESELTIAEMLDRHARRPILSTDELMNRIRDRIRIKDYADLLGLEKDDRCYRCPVCKDYSLTIWHTTDKCYCHNPNCPASKWQDVIGFHCLVKGVGFKQALIDLAAQTGVQIPEYMWPTLTKYACGKNLAWLDEPVHKTKEIKKALGKCGELVLRTIFSLAHNRAEKDPPVIWKELPAFPVSVESVLVPVLPISERQIRYSIDLLEHLGLIEQVPNWELPKERQFRPGAIAPYYIAPVYYEDMWNEVQRKAEEYCRALQESKRAALSLIRKRDSETTLIGSSYWLCLFKGCFYLNELLAFGISPRLIERYFRWEQGREAHRFARVQHVRGDWVYHQRRGALK
jgi:hypothetical protein